jgi:hypothetical protein
MTTPLTPDARIKKAAPFAALALALTLTSQASATKIQLGDSGWEARFHSSLNGLVDIDFISYENNTIFIQKSAEFTQGPVNGVFPTIPITFKQVGDSSAVSIVIDDEIITNSTGVTWTGFVMKAIDHGDVVFNPAMTAASGGGGPIGFSIDPFNSAEFIKGNSKLVISDGLVAPDEQWFPGGGANDGQLWIDVTSGDADNRGLFTLKERPTSTIIPGPSALMSIVGCMCLVGRSRRRR